MLPVQPDMATTLRDLLTKSAFKNYRKSGTYVGRPRLDNSKMQPAVLSDFTCFHEYGPLI